MKYPLLLAMTLAAWSGQRPASTEDGFIPLLAKRDGLEDWHTERVRLDVADGNVRLAAGRGWFYTRKAFADFALRFEVRHLPDFTIVVRGFDHPTKPVGYGLRFKSQRASAVTYGTSTRTFVFDALPPISERFAEGAYVLHDDPDLKRPLLQRREVKPRYTAGALAANIQGTVFLAAVVNIDGSVGDLALLRSLDAQFGLDREAVVAAKQWRFDPAALHGEPVPTLITIEVTFRLGDRP